MRGSYHTLNPESLQLSLDLPTWHQDTVGHAASACCAAVVFASCTNMSQRFITKLPYGCITNTMEQVACVLQQPPCDGHSPKSSCDYILFCNFRLLICGDRDCPRLTLCMMLFQSTWAACDHRYACSPSAASRHHSVLGCARERCDTDTAVSSEANCNNSVTQICRPGLK